MSHLPDDITTLMWELDESTGCWVWTENKWVYKGKYIRYVDAYNERYYLHRWIARSKYGSISKHEKVIHSCGNGLCINPDHIIIVDRYYSMSKRTLLDEEIAAIKRDRRTAKVVAFQYGVSTSLVYKIWAGTRHVLVDSGVGEVNKDWNPPEDKVTVKNGFDWDNLKFPEKESINQRIKELFDEVARANKK